MGCCCLECCRHGAVGTALMGGAGGSFLEKKTSREMLRLSILKTILKKS